MNVSVGDLTSALDAIGFGSSCIATTTTEEPTLEQDGVNAVWAIASALGERGDATAHCCPCRSGSGEILMIWGGCVVSVFCDENVSGRIICVCYNNTGTGWRSRSMTAVRVL